MKITIEPDRKEEEKVKKAVFDNVVEFALTGTVMQENIMPQPFNKTHGDTFVLIGKLAELSERLRKFNDNPN